MLFRLLYEVLSLSKSLTIDIKGLELKDFIELIINKEYGVNHITLSSEVENLIQKSRKTVDKIVENNKIVYGISTGFGHLVNKVIGSDELKELQQNLLMSHSIGLGNNHFLPDNVIRGALLLLINSLSKGKSGVRLETVNALVKLFNSSFIPIIPSMGSLGASGDLAPLAHLAITLLGKGKCKNNDGNVLESKKVLELLKLSPLDLEAKEGLALINGTHFMTSMLLIALNNASLLLKIADINVALCVEVFESNIDAFSEDLIKLRAYPGSLTQARIIRFLVKNSLYVKESRTIQDSYAIRCTPQVHGAIRDTFSYVEQQALIELNSITDNPLIIDDETIVSGGNFHGEPLGFGADFLSIALCELGTIAERRINKLLDPSINKGLPAFLIASPGLNSGLMILQYSVASLVSKNKHLANPNTTDNIPVSANQEDHVSMGFHATQKLLEITENTLEVLIGELLCLRQALGFKNVEKLGSKTKEIFNAISNIIPFIEHDELISENFTNLKRYITGREFENLLGKIFENFESIDPFFKPKRYQNPVGRHIKRKA